MKLYPYQEEAVMFHVKHHYSLNGCEQGLGKTLIALTTAKETGRSKVAVFGPAFLKSAWEYEAEKIGVKVFYIAYSMVHKARVSDFEGLDFWVADECHMLKSPTAQRTNAFYTLLKKVLPEYFIGMSGTPIKNRIPDLWTLLAFCSNNPKKTSGVVLSGSLAKYHGFARHFCNVREMRVAGRMVRKYEGVIPERLDELRGLLRDKMIRFKAANVLKDLPSITRLEVPLPMSTTLRMERELEELFESYNEGSKVNATAKATSARLKAEGVKDYVRSLIEGGAGQVLVFTDHVASALKLAEISPSAKFITGQTPADERSQKVSDFQSGKIDVLVATIGAMSVGVTLTAANHVVFNDMAWTPSDNAQAEKRIHRIGQTKPCFAHYIHSTPTDAYIVKTLLAKIESTNAVIEEPK